MTTKYNDHQHFQLNAICMKSFVVATSLIRTKHVSVISCDETTLYMPVLLVEVPSFVTYCMWENFGGGKFWRINGSKVFGEEKFGESVGSLLKTLAFINIGGENFGELPTVRQIRQNFPPPKFSHVWYNKVYHKNDSRAQNNKLMHY